jgi:hypothetical protein
MSSVHHRFRIISEKKTGMVSGWQLEPNGKIIYSAILPKDTRLSMQVLFTCNKGKKLSTVLDKKFSWGLARAKSACA